MNNTGKIAIHIAVDDAQAKQGLDAVGKGFDGLNNKIASADRNSEALSNSISRMGLAVAAFAAFDISAGGVVHAADAWSNLNAQLKIAAGSAQAGAAAYQDVLRIAMQSGQQLNDVNTVYRRFAENSLALGINSKQVADVTRTAAQAVALSGASAVSAQAALVQFGQALASGQLRGEELNSVMEQSPRLAKALADGIGVPIGKLRELAEQGKITSDEIVKALSGQSGRIAGEFDQLPITISRALTNVKTAFTDVVGGFEKSTGAFGLLASGIDSVAKSMDALAITGGIAAAAMLGKTTGALIAATAATVAKGNAARAAAAFALEEAAAEQAKAAALAQSTMMMRANFAATEQLALANASLATATAGAAAAGRGAMVIGALGGPIGIVTTALALGATAWAIWGQKTQSATQEAATSALQNIDNIIVKVAEMNGRLDQITRKSYDATIKSAQAAITGNANEAARVGLEIERINAKNGGKITKEVIDLEKQLVSMLEKDKQLQEEIGEARAKAADVGTAALTKFIDANAVGAEAVRVKQTKLLNEFAQAVAQTGGVFDVKVHQPALDALNAGLDDLVKKKAKLSNATNTNAAAEAERRAWLKYLDDEAEAEARAVHALNVYYAERQKAADDWVQDEQKRSASLADGTAKLQEEYSTLGLGTEALARYRVEKLEAAAASDTLAANMLEEAAAHLNELNVLPDVAQAYRELAAAKRESAGQFGQQAVTTANLAGKQIAVDAAKASAEEWKRFSNDIERSLTDALMRSFESGESFGSAFIKNLKNALKTSALKVVINAVVGGAGSIVGNLGNSALNAVFGTGGSNGGGGTDYLGIASNAQSASSLYTTATTAYAAYTAGAGALPGTLGAANAAGYLGADSLGAFIAMNPQWAGAAGAAAPTAAVAPTVAAEGASAGLGTLGVYAAVFAAVANLIGNAGTRPTKYDNVELFGTYKDGELQGGEIGTQFKAAGGWASGEKIYQAARMPLTSDRDAILKAYLGDPSQWSYTYDYAQSSPDATYTKANDLSELADLSKLTWAQNADQQKDLVSAFLEGAKSNAKLNPENPEWFDGTGYERDGFGRAYYDTIPKSILEQSERVYGPDQLDVVTAGKVSPITTDPKILGYIGEAIEAIFKNTQAAFTGLAQSFDDTALVERIADFEMSISTTGTTIEEMMTKVATSATQQMQAAFLPSIDGLRKAASADGKTAAETWDQAFSRVMIEVSATSRILDLMGTSLKEAFTGLDTNAALASVDALNQLFGGADQLTTAFNAYYDNFFTEEEKRANAMGEMGKAFAALNLEIPDSRAGFKALVDGLDLATASGQLTFKALMDLQGGFAELYPAIEETSTAIADLRKSLAEKYAAPLTLDQAKTQITAAGGAPLLDAASLEDARQMLSDFISTTTSEGLNAVQALEPALDLYLSSLIDQKTAAENAAKAIENATNSMRSLGDSLVAYDDATSGDKGALGRQLADAFAGLGLAMPTSVSDYQDMVAKYRGPDDANVQAYGNVLDTLNAISQSIAAWATNDQPILKATEEYLNNKGIGLGQLESSLADDGYSQSDVAAWMTKYNAAANPAWAGMAKGITDFVKNNLGVNFDVSAWDSAATAQTQLAAAISAIGNDPAKLQTLVGLSTNVDKYFATASDTTAAGPSADDLAAAIATALGQLRDISYIGLDQDAIAQREATRLTTDAKSQFQTLLKDVDLSSVKSLQDFAASLDATDVASQPLIESLSALASVLYQVEAAAKQAAETAKDQQRGIDYLGLDSNVVARLEAARLANAITAEFGSQVAGVDFTSLPAVQAFAASLDAADPAAQKLIASLSELGASMSSTSQAAKQALLQTAQTEANNAYSALERAVDAERKTIQGRIEASQEQVNSLSSIFDTLDSGIAQLRSTSEDNVQAEATKGRAFINDALSAALSSGYLPDPDELSKAVSAAIKGQESQIFASQSDAAFQNAVLAGQMEKLKAVAGDQKTVAEQALDAAEDQLKSLSALLAEQKKLLDAANGIDVSVKSVAQAVADLAIAIGNLKFATAAAPTAMHTAANNTPYQSTSTPTNYGSVVNNFVGTTGEAIRVMAAGSATPVLDVGANWSASQITQQAISNMKVFGVDSAKSAAIINWAKSSDQVDTAALKAAGIPGFAVGANRIPQDMVAMIHKDEAIIPAAFNPWLNNGGTKDDRTATLIKSLLAQNQRLEDRLMAIETHTRRTFNTLDNVTEGGNAMRQVTA